MFFPLQKLIDKSSWRGASHRGDWSPWRNRISGIFLKLSCYSLMGLYYQWSPLLRSMYKCPSLALGYFHWFCLPSEGSLKVKWVKDDQGQVFLSEKRFFSGLLTGVWVSKEPWPGSQGVWDPGLGVKRSWTLLTNYKAYIIYLNLPGLQSHHL